MARTDVPKHHVTWAKARLQNKEVISMETFAQAFGYLEEKDGDDCFMALLSQPCFSSSTRREVLEDYRIWQRNGGPGFWARRKATLATTQIAGELVRAGWEVAKQRLEASGMIMAPDPTVGERPIIGISFTTGSASSSTIKQGKTSSEKDTRGGWATFANYPDRHGVVSSTASRTTIDNAVKATALAIMDHISECISRKSFPPGCTALRFVHTWDMIFSGLLADIGLTVSIGESVSKASADARRRAETGQGLENSKAPAGRKGDTALWIQLDNDLQTAIAVFEIKSANSSAQALETQQEESILRNMALLWDLQKRGLNHVQQYPVVAVGEGLRLDLYTLRRYDDIFGAGWATKNRMVLPEDDWGLKSFLQGEGLATLFALKEHLRRYAIDVRDVLEQARSRRTDISDEDGHDDCGLSSQTSSLDTSSSSKTSMPPTAKRPNSSVGCSSSKKSKHSESQPGNDDVDEG
ncbi:hypothetical protein DFQ27_009764 [Actinomortierella ambigua]|uniref:Uncharacterized protein n=1 Tax=Actinomortierella ambigua TaxID=1343610 RepID=A0A9P6TW70_9FUNG|nr:hypothetical protein DFQ27_009764 [Actinomortierella ambigua]